MLLKKRIDYKSMDGTHNYFTHEFLAPVQTGKKSLANISTARVNKGTGNDRAIATTVTKMIKLCGDRAVLPEVILQQQESFDINPNVKSLCGISNCNNNSHRTPLLNNNNKKKRGNILHQYVEQSYIFVLNELTPKEIKRRTGFCDLFYLLSYVIIICGGDMDQITVTSTKLTWLEEWIFFFEYIYGHSKNRLCDYESEYNLCRNACRMLFRSKLLLAMKARNRWPMYASHEEDCKLRKEKWNDQFKDKRIIMHDNTNITLVTPYYADKQRSLRSKYNAECCAKGGVSIQMCGWIRALHLFTGGIDDSKYIERSEILKQQQLFQEGDESSNNQFINIFDKGYRVTLLARDHAQSCLQPIFAQSDIQFFRNELLHSASVAVIRSGNERAVKIMKYSWILQRGINHPNFKLSVLDDIWLAWGFQINFMYNTVL